VQLRILTSDEYKTICAIMTPASKILDDLRATRSLPGKIVKGASHRDA
jgi:hypothetical protein